jgi:pimeloyl-ACP methyl ester carboxylesterase
LGRFINAPYREVRIPDSAHWVQNEAIDEVNTALLEFLGDDSLKATSANTRA